jgi:hypothetical protein
MRGESALWSVAMITACVALVAVSVVAIWVAQRGGHIDGADEALSGVGRAARAWAAAAAAVPEVQAEGAVDAGAPQNAADAAAEVVDAGDAGAAEEADAGDEEAETEEEADAGAPDAAATAKAPAKKKKKPIKKPRRR